jgi:DNA-binding winged helix-turn-helix (wHTH) protein/TolB-like protein/Tfp pilus assembly protein PilF
MPQQNGGNGKFEGFSVDVNRKVLLRGGEIVDLPPKAVEMLIVLLRNRGKVVTKQELLDSVWGDAFVEESVLSNNVYMLRKAIGEIEPGKQLIRTVPRRGYKFEDSFDDPSSEFVLEHHVFEQTLIEDVSAPEPAQIYRPAGASALAAASITRKWYARPALAAGTIALLVIASSFGARQWSQPSTTTDATTIRSIAVLPLRPIGGAENDQVVALGLADALITQLGASKRLVIRPMSSVASYAGKEFDPVDAGRKLGSDAVLEGTFQRSYDRFRVTARLIRVSDGSQIWAGTFNDTKSDIFALQDAIATDAAKALIANISQQDRDMVLRRYKTNGDAYDAYLRGRFHYHSSNPATDERLRNAAEEFDKALSFDPNYALAYAGLADAYARLGNSASDTNRKPFYEKARANAVKALELDDNLAETHAAIGWINRIYDWNWPESETHLRRAVELAPNDARFYHLLSFLQITLGQTKEAVETARRARDLDPVNKTSVYAFALMSDRQFDAGIAEDMKVLDVTGDLTIWRALVGAYVAAGKPAEALAIYERTPAAQKDEFAIRIYLPLIYGQLGDKARSDVELKKLEASAQNTEGRTVRLSSIYAALGHTDHALSSLERGLAARDDRMMWVKTNPLFDGIRKEPRFRKLIAEMNLPPDA